MPDLKEFKNTFKIQDFRGQQEKIIKHTMEGRNSLVLMPTGGGKSLCYQAPIYMQDKMGIIISPLISLMKDQVDKLRSLGLCAHFLNSSLDYEEKKEVFNDIVSGECKYLYVAPESALKKSFINFIKKIDISLIAIDESHCISKWGHQFRPEYQALGNLIKFFPNIPIMALTATASKVTRKDIINSLSINDATIFLNSFNRKNIYLEFHRKKNESNQLIQYLTENFDKSGRVIIYCLSRKRVEMFTQFLQTLGHEVKGYHAGMSAQKRDQVQRWFSQKSGRIVVATIAFGMGIDLPDIRLVIHMDLPKNIESYYQEIGRAGRDGEASSSVLFFSRRDRALLINMASSGDNNLYHKEVFGINHIYGVARSAGCRRKLLLMGFDEKLKIQHERCCDNCEYNNNGNFVDSTEEALRLLTLILKSPQLKNYKQWREYIVEKKLFPKITIHFKNKQHAVEELIFQLMGYGLLEVNFDGKLVVCRSFEQLDDFTLKIPIDRGDTRFLKPERINAKINRELDIQSAKSVDANLNLSNYEEENLRDLLKEFRRKQAKKRRIPAYKIFSDKTIDSIIEIRPTHSNEFLEVYGFGEKKVRKYADSILQI